VVYRNFGRNEIPDHVAVLKQLASQRSYIDMNRTGIYGGSWGGYMTVRGMLLAPEVFKVGVSIYPVVDLYDHWALPIETFIDTPEHNREGYEYGSSLRLAGNLQGKLLLIHGTSDVKWDGRANDVRRYPQGTGCKRPEKSCARSQHSKCAFLIAFERSSWVYGGILKHRRNRNETT
jgi:dienelactone hydrolase